VNKLMSGNADCIMLIYSRYGANLDDPTPDDTSFPNHGTMEQNVGVFTRFQHGIKYAINDSGSAGRSAFWMAGSHVILKNTLDSRSYLSN